MFLITTILLTILVFGVLCGAYIMLYVGLFPHFANRDLTIISIVTVQIVYWFGVYVLFQELKS